MGYTSAPTVIIGMAWAPNISYAAGTQVFMAITCILLQQQVLPQQHLLPTPAAPLPRGDGAVFAYAGIRATATATVATYAVDAPASLSKDDFKRYLVDERPANYALRRAGNLIWYGGVYFYHK
ncbi:hypothetical protein LWM68_21580 [Niabella sp. W65]|nr:hypothetical protein [Niabella sp. W65]MCH7365121.1 hypothetical protein [Niabella sp. W65]